jgi:hypothetical protein
MATWTPLPGAQPRANSQPTEPGGRAIVAALGIALVFVLATRWPVARTRPLDPDEIGFLEQTAVHWFPMHHTLFQALARALGQLAGDPYRGFILLDMLSSALALAGAWWWLRALVRPATAATGTLVLGVGPVFWGYGAMAGNYTAIVLVGSLLLGIAVRGSRCPEAWQPMTAAVVLALGTGYRPDLGVLWLPVFLIILWQHRWRRAVRAGLVFTLLNLAWLGAMLADVGGWARYRAATAEFGSEAGLRNSVWSLGLIDGPLRYGLKLGMALLWTLGPALGFVPRGLARLRRAEHGAFLGGLLGLSVVPPLALHLLIHFGVPGYSFHYLPALIALVALGIGRPAVEGSGEGPGGLPAIAAGADRAVPRLLGLAIVLGAAFWFYPTDYSAPGWRGEIDLSFCRFTRIGLRTPPPRRGPSLWRTANSRDLTGLPIRRPDVDGVRRE